MITKFDTFLDVLGRWLAARLTDESGYEPFTPSDPETLRQSLRPADVLLVEGSQKVSTAIKYLTQSTWSHAALYVGDALANDLPSDLCDETSSATTDGQPNELIEVNLGEGCVAVPLAKYATFNTRICRPVGLMADDRARIVAFMTERLGTEYDMRNILDLARFLFPTPPIPARWRRRMISLGSGEPTRAICSTLIAQAFQSLRYPILPRIEFTKGQSRRPGMERRREIYHIRHHSLFAPCDFDLSPYFAIIKPTVEHGFDYKSVRWSATGDKTSDKLRDKPQHKPQKTSPNKTLDKPLIRTKITTETTGENTDKSTATTAPPKSPGKVRSSPQITSAAKQAATAATQLASKAVRKALRQDGKPAQSKGKHKSEDKKQKNARKSSSKSEQSATTAADKKSVKENAS